MHAELPDLWDSEEPESEFVDIVLAARGQMEARKKWKTLRDGRENVRKTSTGRTIAGKRKVEGRKRMSEIHPPIAGIAQCLLAEAILQAEGHRRANKKRFQTLRATSSRRE